MSLLSLSWRDVCFLHWDLDPDVVAARLPDGLDVDTCDGRAWLGVVPLEITAGGRSFAELNLRTYVRRDGEPGVYFFSLDAADPAAVAAARAAYGLPYYRAEAGLRERDGAVRFDHRRTHPDAAPARFRATYAPDGERSEAAPGSLAAFLVERYRYYLERGGRLWAGDVDHAPWRPAPATATVASNTLPAAAGFDVRGDPHLLYAAHDGMRVEAGPVRPV
ncbi:hypothetical protein BRD13_03335 [Halobacteriales archaeon SW_5_70_135]|nr:MAG: hypothetical protein BRD13_03335 [Halobacteriales archaeon SW_5_70_135]